MTCNRSWLVNYRDTVPVKVYLEDDSMVNVLGIGDIEVIMETPSGPILEMFKDVLYVPGLAKNLLSVSRSAINGVRAFFDVCECQLIDKSGEIVGVTVRDGNLYVVKCQPVINRGKEDKEAATVATTNSMMDTWHQQLGHINNESLKQLPKHVEGLQLPKNAEAAQVCKSYALGKQQQQRVTTKPAECAKHILELMHTDVCGLMQTTSIGRSRFFVMFTDNVLRKMWIYFLKSKN